MQRAKRREKNQDADLKAFLDADHKISKGRLVLFTGYASVVSQVAKM